MFAHLHIRPCPLACFEHFNQISVLFFIQITHQNLCGAGHSTATVQIIYSRLFLWALKFRFAPPLSSAIATVICKSGFFFSLCRKTMRLNFRILRIFNILQRVPWDFMCKTTWLQYCILHKSLDQISSKWKLVFKIYIYIYVCIFRFLWLSFFVTLICSELFLAALLVFVCIWPLPLVPVT